MRILKLNLLVAAMLFLGIGSANAFSISMLATANDHGGAHSGTAILDVSDTVTVTVMFDTQGALSTSNRLMLLGVGLLFDDAILDYVQPASSTPTYLLYVSAKTAYLVPASTCTGPGGPPSGQACALYGINPAQVQLDFVSNQLIALVGVPTNSAPGGTSLGTYRFHVSALGDGLADLSFVFADQSGGVLQTSTGLQTLALGTGQSFVVPEPTTAVLVSLGLVGLGLAGRRRE